MSYLYWRKISAGVGSFVEPITVWDRPRQFDVLEQPEPMKEMSFWDIDAPHLCIPIQEKYWEYFKLTKWNKNRTTKPQYSILEAVLISNPDFNNLDKLSKQVKDKLVLVTEEVIQEMKTSKLH